MNKVIVVGSDHHNTLGVVRSLGEKGIKSHLIVYSEHVGREFVSKSKYLASSHLFAKCDVSIIDFICANYESHDEPSILIGTSDAACLLIDSNLKRLKNFICANCNNVEHGISYWMDKHLMNKQAKICGLNVPESILLRNGNTLDISQVNFPCIVKPLESARGNKHDITICKNKGELGKALDIFKSQSIDILIQDFLDAEYEIGIMGCSYYSNKECWIPDVITKKRFSNKSATFAMVEDITLKEELADTVKCLKKLVYEIGYTGIFDSDLLYCNGKFYFIEMNLRNGAYGYALSKAGANFAYEWYYDAVTGEHKKHDNIQLTYLMSEFSDFKNFRLAGISVFEWIQQYVHSTHMVMQFRDIKPVVAFLKQRMGI